MRKPITSDEPSPAQVEYEHARKLMNAQELGYPVQWRGRNNFIQELHRVLDPNGSGLKTFIYLSGNPEIIPASEISIAERPQ